MTNEMTTADYQKRLLFLEHIKKNYVAIKGQLLIFYFEDYDIHTIKSEYTLPNHAVLCYNYERSKKDSGAVVLVHGYNGEVRLSLADKYISIILDLTHNCTLHSELEEPFDLEKVKNEFKELFKLLKTK